MYMGCTCMCHHTFILHVTFMHSGFIRVYVLDLYDKAIKRRNRETHTHTKTSRHICACIS